MKFLDLAVLGSVKPEDIDSVIAKWHEDKSETQPLQSYIGFTDKEYDRWIKDSKAIVDIVNERKALYDRIKLLDKALEPMIRTLDAISILRRVYREFPIPGSGMDPDFKGSHSLTLKDGKLFLNIWANGQCHQCYFNINE